MSPRRSVVEPAAAWPTRWRPGAVLPAVIALAVLLALTANRYGYHRDELYFLTLPPAWGYVDQPPFLPWLARNISTLSPTLSALRLPALVFATASVLVVAGLTREVGGGRLAQGLAAWGYAFGTFTLTFGHVLLTASVDLLVWPLIVLCVVRAVLRRQPRWWLPAGVVIGLSTYNKWLVVLLVLALVAGFLLVGPRQILLSRAVLAGALLAVLIAMPNVIWQFRHGLPQVAMGRALSAQNADDVRVSALPILLVLIGPIAAPAWIAGFVALLRRTAWRPIRFLAPALVVVIALTVAGGSQVYYPYGLVAVVFAIGCVPVADFAGRTDGRRRLVLALTGLHVLSGALISGSVLPLSVLARTFVPATNQTIGDQVGWPAYVAQIDAVTAAVRLDDPDVAVLTSNYGEAGALHRFTTLAEVPMVSGLNALWDQGGPPVDTRTVVVVGGQLREAIPLFATCTVRQRLHSGVPIENEEEGEPVAVCVGPRGPWSELWPKLRHLG